VSPGELVGPAVDMAVSLVAGQETERTGAFPDDLLEVRAAASARSRWRRLALRLGPAARWRRWFCSHRPPECRTPYGASIDWMREASSLILNGFASVWTFPYASSFGAVEAFTNALTTSTLGSLP
jgi:hypothetical protein